jgi:hypothetical protein
VPEFAFKVKLTARVSVCAVSEIVARAVATSVLLAVSVGDISIPDENDSVREFSFSVESLPLLDAIDGKRAKRSGTKRR